MVVSTSTEAISGKTQNTTFLSFQHKKSTLQFISREADICVLHHICSYHTQQKIHLSLLDIYTPMLIYSILYGMGTQNIHSIHKIYIHHTPYNTIHSTLKFKVLSQKSHISTHHTSTYHIFRSFFFPHKQLVDNVCITGHSSEKNIESTFIYTECIFVINKYPTIHLTIQPNHPTV